MAIQLQQAIDYSKANPTSDYAAKIGTAIKSGAFDSIAQQQGVDLSPYGRPAPQNKPDSSLGTMADTAGTILKTAVNPIAPVVNAAANKIQPDITQTISKLGQRGQNVMADVQKSGETALQAESNLKDMGVPAPVATAGAVGLTGAELGGRVAGEVAGGALDIAGGAISALSPQWLKDLAKSGVTALANTPAGQATIKTVSDAYNKIPDEVKPNVDALINTLGLMGGGAAAEVAPKAVGAGADVVKSAARAAKTDVLGTTQDRIATAVAKAAEDWKKPTLPGATSNPASFNKATDILAKTPDIPNFLAQQKLSPLNMVENGRYATADTADALRSTAGKMSSDTLRPSLQMADYSTPKTPVKDIVQGAIKSVGTEPGVTAGDREAIIAKLTKELPALEKRYPNGMSLTDMHDEKITYAQNGGYKPTSISDNNIATANRLLSTSLGKTVETKAPDSIPVGDFNAYLSKYYKAADYLSALDNKKAPRGTLLDVAKRTAQVIGAGAGHAVGGGLLGGVGGYLIGGSIEHALENMTTPMRAQFLRNLEITNPPAFTKVADYLKGASTGKTGLLSLPPATSQSPIPLGPSTVKESVAPYAAKTPLPTANPKTGRMQTTFTSSPR